MKQIIFLIYFSLVFLLINCDKNSFCPDRPVYHFFSEDELQFLWYDIDSALSLQQRLNSGEIGQYDLKSEYVTIDTIYFVDKKNDTIDFTIRNIIRTGHNQWCSNDIPMYAQTALIDYNENILKKLELIMEKNIGADFITRINIEFTNELGYYSGYKLMDTIQFEYNIFDGYVNNSNITNLIINHDNYIFNEEVLENTMIIRFIDEFFTEKIKIIYSNKYGYLNITKNKTDEIKRIL